MHEGYIHIIINNTTKSYNKAIQRSHHFIIAFYYVLLIVLHQMVR